MVPVRALEAVNWSALAGTAHRVPVEVIGTGRRAADALTDGLVENFIFGALCRAALALADIGVDVLIG